MVPTQDDPILKRNVGHLKESPYLAHRISRTTKEDCLVSTSTFFSRRGLCSGESRNILQGKGGGGNSKKGSIYSDKGPDSSGYHFTMLK